MSILKRFEGLAFAEAQELFLNMSAREQAEVITATATPDQQRKWLRMLHPDEVANVIQCVSQAERFPLLALLDRTTSAEVIALLAYGEDAAGGLMSPRYTRVRPELTVTEAISYVRKQHGNDRGRHYIYVLDSDQRLIGVISARELLMANPDSRIGDMMVQEVVSVDDRLPREEVGRIFASHKFSTLPVVNAEGAMKGVITASDIVDVMGSEATEDIQKIGGSEALSGPYLKVRLLEMIKKRAGWLVALFIGEMFTATAMSQFQDEIAKAVVLALFVPLIISSGGNVGSQATTLVIRAMALGELKLRDWWRVIVRESATGLALGVVLGTIGIMRILLWQAISPTYGDHYVLVALTVAFSLVFISMWGAVIGSILPFALRKLGWDPASASAPFVATLVDVTGLIIYFSVGKIMLSGTML